MKQLKMSMKIEEVVALVRTVKVHEAIKYFGKTLFYTTFFTLSLFCVNKLNYKIFLSFSEYPYKVKKNLIPMGFLLTRN